MKTNNKLQNKELQVYYTVGDTMKALTIVLLIFVIGFMVIFTPLEMAFNILVIVMSSVTLTALCLLKEAQNGN